MRAIMKCSHLPQCTGPGRVLLPAGPTEVGFEAYDHLLDVMTHEALTLSRSCQLVTAPPNSTCKGGGHVRDILNHLCST